MSSRLKAALILFFFAYLLLLVLPDVSFAAGQAQQDIEQSTLISTENWVMIGVVGSGLLLLIGRVLTNLPEKNTL